MVRQSARNGWLAACIALAFVPVLVPWFAKGDDDRLFLYTYGALMPLLAASLSFSVRRRQSREARTLWTISTWYFALNGLSYVPFLLFALWPALPQRFCTWAGTGLSSVSLILLFVAITIAPVRLSRRLRRLDGLLALLVCLAINAALLSRHGEGFAHFHLYIVFVLAVFKMVLALVSWKAARTEAERSFIMALACSLVVNVPVIFLGDVVNYAILARPHLLPFDVFYSWPELTFCVLAAGLLQASPTGRNSPVNHRPLVQSLLPSLLIVSGIAISCFLLPYHAAAAAVLILLLIAVYFARTHVLYRIMLVEHAALRTEAGYFQQLATQDALTGVGNRRRLQQFVEDLQTSARSVPVALLVIDTDRFKHVNDAFGHATGDSVLRSIGSLLLRETQTIERACCARVGGDEFTVIVVDQPGASVERMAKSLLKEVHSIRIGAGFQPSVSIGIAFCSALTDFDALLLKADAALYRAKSEGRNRIAMETL